MRAGTEIVIPLAGLVDVDAERARLGKELEKVEKDIAFFERKLGNPKFVEKAPAAVVDKDRAKLADAQAARESLVDAMDRLATLA